MMQPQQPQSQPRLQSQPQAPGAKRVTLESAKRQFLAEQIGNLEYQKFQAEFQLSAINAALKAAQTEYAEFELEQTKQAAIPDAGADGRNPITG